MNEIQVRESPEAIIVRLDEARHALTVARNNFERLCVRHHARAVEAAAAGLGRREIQVEASVLVQEAEREIAKANPANPGGKGTSNKSSVMQDNATPLSAGVIRQMRLAHDSIEDEEFAEIIVAATKNKEPLTRKTLLERSKRKTVRSATNN